MDEKCIKLEDLTRVALEPGDVLFIRCEGDERRRVTIRQLVKRCFPDNEVLVASPDVEMFVVGQEGLDETGS